MQNTSHLGDGHFSLSNDIKHQSLFPLDSPGSPLLAAHRIKHILRAYDSSGLPGPGPGPF